MKLTRREAARLIGTGLVGSAFPAWGQTAREPDPRPVQPIITPPDELLAAPISRIAGAIRNGEVSSEEITLAYLRRIEAINPMINAIVRVSAEHAVRAARQADAALASGLQPGPLHGVPMTLKDSIDTAGVVTTWGTLGRSEFVPDRDATVAARLKAAGAVLLGKTNTPEFTLSFETDNLIYGRSKNPFDIERTPGGSSGGAAAAVSTALCAFDIGSDTGGSIRFPSHCCGTAGLKPTQGRVPRTGHAVSFGGIQDSLTQLGPIARTVDDLELVLGVIAGPDGHDPFVAPAPLRPSARLAVSELRIGWHDDNGFFTPSDEIRSLTESAGKALGNSGAAMRQIVPPPIPSRYEAFDELFLWESDGAAWIQRMLEAAGTRKAHPRIARQITDERKVDSAELTRLMERRDRFRSEMLAFMQDYDALLTPVVGFMAPVFGHTEDQQIFPGYSYTQVYNLAGMPAAVVRCGTSAEGLPIGLQVAARPWREDVALAVARHLESIFGGWKEPGLAG
jgi:amidase